MIGKKVGTIRDIFSKNSSLNTYILMGLFEDISLGGKASDLQQDFKIRIPEDLNFITIKKISDNRLSIQIGIFKDRKDDKISGVVSTKITLVIHYDESDFGVYNSEY